MKRRHGPICLLLLLIPAGGLRAVDPDSLTDATVERAREAIVEMIWSHQDPQRHWDPVTMPEYESTNQHLGGYTALACLALITAGESYQDPRFERPLADLQRAELRGTYAVSTRAAIWAELPQRFRPRLQQDADWLMKSWNVDAAGWDYRANPDGTLSRPSPSVRHFGTLALWAASRRGITIPPGLLDALERVTIRNQRADGAWHYPSSGQPRSSGSMTAAGLLTLYITQELLHAEEYRRLRRDASSPVSEAIDRGLSWMDDNYDPRRNPGGGRGSRFPMYYQYAVERVALAGGLRTFGGHDWFREGAATILDRLFDERGGELVLKSTYAPGGKASALRELCFSLLFLSRGRAPIAVNKLRFDGRWNNRPRDMVNWTRWLSEEREIDVNWQVVDIDSEPETWLDAPILCIVSDEELPWIAPQREAIRTFDREASAYLERRRNGTLASGERPPRPPSIDEVEKIRRFIARGGLVLAINEGRSDAFAASVRDMGTLLNPRAEWKTVEQDDAIYRTPVKIAKRTKILALSNGVRDQILLIPGGDVSADLQVINRKSEPVLQTLSNIHAQASGMNRFRPRLDAARSGWNGAAGSTRAALVRGVHGGNWKAEADAMRALQSALGESQDIALTVRDRRLSDLARDGRPDLLVLSGTEATSLDDADWDAIEQYVRRDRGVVLVEHAGGADAGVFAATLEQAAMDRFAAPVRSARRTPVITAQGLAGATDCSAIRWTPYSVMEVFGAGEREPRLRCIEVDDRPAIFFSREDLSHALLDQPGWGIHGYDHDSAVRLMANLIRHGIASRPAAP
ncbi:MAG: hypothetical protein VX727_06875 [Planctomycetota bacterium]|nr:hypothetical protein [Planctomycetota bacterium]